MWWQLRWCWGGLVVVVVVVVVLVVVAGSGSSIRNIIVNTTINVVAAMLTEKCRLWLSASKRPCYSGADKPNRYETFLPLNHPISPG